MLYGTGHIRLGSDGKPTRVGGVDYTIKDGIVFDAKKLMRDVRESVATEKKNRGIEIYAQPGERSARRTSGLHDQPERCAYTYSDGA